MFPKTAVRASMGSGLNGQRGRALGRVRSALVAVLGLMLVGICAFVTVHWQPDIPVEQLQQRWAKPPSQWIAVSIPALDGAPPTRIRLHVRDEGQRDDPEPIVLIHGTAASLHTWDGWTEQLAPTRRVIRLDLPGYGLTGPFEDHIYSMPRYSAVLSALADVLKLPPAVYAGNSLGGLIAWQHAVRDAQRVSRLLLVDAAGYPLPLQDIPIGFRIARTPVLNELMKNVLPRSVIEGSIKNVYAEPSRVTSELIDRYYELTARAGNRAAVTASFQQRNADTQNGAWIPKIKTIQQPTFILWGQEDRLIPPEQAQLFKRDIPHAELVILPGLGHVPMEEDPRVSLAAVASWLSARRTP